MPKPDIDPVNMAKFEATAEEFLTSKLPEIEYIYNTMGDTPEIRAIFREIFIAGEWLRSELIKRKCPDNQIGSVLFAAGQRSVGNDPWEAALKSLEFYDSGKPEIPGPELSQKLFKESKDKRKYIYEKF